MTPLQRALARLERIINTPAPQRRIGDLLLDVDEAEALRDLFDVRGPVSAHPVPASLPSRQLPCGHAPEAFNAEDGFCVESVPASEEERGK